MGWVVNATPRPLYPGERPGTHCIGGWVGFRAGLDRCRKSRPAGIRSPDRPARSESLYRLGYPARNYLWIQKVFSKRCRRSTSYLKAEAACTFQMKMIICRLHDVINLKVMIFLFIATVCNCWLTNCRALRMLANRNLY